MSTLHMYVIFLLALFSGGVDAAITASELVDSLLTNSGYKAFLLPACGPAVQVRIGLAIRQIIELDEPKQVLETNVWVRLAWDDCRLKWNATETGIPMLVVPYGTVWVPDITLYDNSQNGLGGFTSYRHSIYPDGTVNYNFPTVIKSLCKVDVTYFPFDTQTCHLQFGSWAHDGFDLNITKRSEAGDISSYVSNGEWEIVGVPAIRHELYYTCCPQPFPDVTFYIQLKRRPLFYVLNLLFPCTLISTMAILGFILPPDSGEKVSLEITVLLSLAVFLLVVSETMPPTSETFPAIGVYFAGAMILVSLSCVMTVLVLNLHFKGGHGKLMPGCIRYVFLRVIGPVLRVKVRPTDRNRRAYAQSYMSESIPHGTQPPDHMTSNGTADHDNSVNKTLKDLKELNVGQLNVSGESSSEIMNILYKQLAAIQNIHEYIAHKKVLEETAEEWQLLAQVIDRMFMVVFLVIQVGVTVGILVKITTGVETAIE